MDTKPLPQSDYSQHLPYLRLTAEQIIKDFGFFGHQITFSGNAESAYQELYEQIIPLVRHLVEKDFAAFCSLLYRIDLGEELVRKLMHKSDDFCGEITHQILRRELQKVVLRSHFKSAHNSQDAPPSLE